MDLITIEELEGALGALEDEVSAGRYIAGVSDYINNYCLTSFEFFEDDTKRLMMDVKGEVTLPGPPIHSVSDIRDPRYNQSDQYIDWDLIGTLYYGLPNQVVDVTYTHGLDGAPQDVKDLIIAGVGNLLDGGGSGQAATEFQVGDVMEKYGPGFIDQFLGNQALYVLARYGGGVGFTIEVGERYYPDYKGNRSYLLDPEA